MSWWLFTRSAIEALTEPADVDACDFAVQDLARDSALGSAVRGAGGIAERAWTASRARGAVWAIARTLTPEPAAAAWRVRGWMAVSAGVTILMLNASKPVPVGPLSSLVPSLVIAAGALTMLLAAPLARAAADRGDKVS